MRARIAWLAAALASGVTLAFVVPLCLLVRTMAVDGALGSTRENAQAAAALVAGVDDPASLPAALGQLSSTRTHTTYVSLPGGQVLGDPAAAPAGAALVARARAESRGVSVTGPDRVDVLVPVGVSDGVAVVHASADLTVVREGVYAAWLVLAALGLAVIGGSVVLARRFGDRIGAPVTEMATVAHRLRSGDLTARAQVSGPQELVELGTALNRLAGRIDELVRAERESVADLSHRLRTPVTALRLDAEHVADPVVRERLRGHVEQLHRAVDSIVSDARRPTRELLGGGCDAAAVAAERAAHWAPLAEDQQRRATVELPGRPVPVGLGAHDLADLLDNLLDNVSAHTPEGAAYRVVVREDGTAATLNVEDAGGGEPEQVLVGRGESGDGGTGLGLDIVRRLARAAGGDVQVTRSSMGGAAAVVRLPLVVETDG